jgi:transketolase
MNAIGKEIRKKMLEISCATGHGHLPTCFSVVEILLAVYQTINHDPKNPSWPQRDIFVLSKGHAALGHYCVLADLGYFPAKKLESFGGFMSDLGCHADRCKVPGIEVSTGSLGHGIGVSAGIALAARIRKIDRAVITLIGDGEANEGSVWEAVMVAADLKLNNLTVIFDHNMSQLRGLQIKNPAEIFSAFGCDVVEVDGHDIDQIKRALGKPAERVKVIVARTQKGFGCRTFVQNQFEWHRKSPTRAELLQLKGELDEETI